LSIVVIRYKGFWPLSVPTLCRAMVASRHPLRSTPIGEFLKRLGGITPEYEALARATALRSIEARAIPRRSVSLS
jgi:hypothetical protein